MMRISTENITATIKNANMLEGEDQANEKIQVLN